MGGLELDATATKGLLVGLDRARLQHNYHSAWTINCQPYIEGLGNGCHGAHHMAAERLPSGLVPSAINVQRLGLVPVVEKSTKYGFGGLEAIRQL